uniref:Uncharacterized protein n=1 Tax=Rangifer tarandus platyrhynchus TaxID=3082113 RepID=A0ACB0FAQ8_RANTA|nr:unnamed protein product [Rangifer tarandus platyrhynchus]
MSSPVLRFCFVHIGPSLASLLPMGTESMKSRNSTECWRRSEKQLRCQEVAAGIEGEQELGGHLAGITTVELVKHKAQVLQQQAETESRIQLLSSPASRHTATLQVV